jgi:hypothetical protein
MAGLLACGSLRCAAFPRGPIHPAQWLRLSTYRLQLRGQPWFWTDTEGVQSAPHSLFALGLPRGHLLAAVHPRDPGLSMAVRASSGAVDLKAIVVSRAMPYPQKALGCSVPPVKWPSETGSRCDRALHAQSRHCPRNGRRSKANPSHCVMGRGKTIASACIRPSRVRRPARVRGADTFAAGDGECR